MPEIATGSTAICLPFLHIQNGDAKKKKLFRTWKGSVYRWNILEKAVLTSYVHSQFKLKVYKAADLETWITIIHPRPSPTSTWSWALAPPAMSSRGPRPPNDSISSPVSPHPHEVACVLNTIAEILAATEIIQRDHEVYYRICLRQLNSYQFVNCRSNSREENHVYLLPHWTEYLPSQNLYGKRSCRSLYPPSRHFTSP